jgi:4-hydroxy-4-methyl-2-oxoglutarate aldolase
MQTSGLSKVCLNIQTYLTVPGILVLLKLNWELLFIMKKHEILIERPEEKLIQRASQYSTATLHEAFEKKGALPSGLKPITPEFRICGPAFTVSSPPGDNLMLHQAIYMAKPGDILVVEVSGYYEAGYWGDIMTHAAMQRGIKGLIIDG